MKSLTVIVFAFATAFAAEQVLSQSAPPAPANPRQSAGKTGGMVSRQVGDGGSVRFIDICGKLPKNVDEIFVKMAKSFDVLADAKTVSKDAGETCPMKIAKKALAEKDVAVAIVISAEGTDAPSLIVCPEDKTAVINADKLAQNLPAEKAQETFDARIEKEMWRAVAFVLGGWESDLPCVMKSVKSTAELDSIDITVTCPQVNAKIAKNAKQMGIKRMQYAPYLVAARQGWAPAPTNDAQKVLWNRFNKDKAPAETAPLEKDDAEAKPAEAK